VDLQIAAQIRSLQTKERRKIETASLDRKYLADLSAARIEL